MADLNKIKRIDGGTLGHVSQGKNRIQSISSGALRPASIKPAVIVWTGGTYEGPYEVTPTQNTQVLETAGKHMQTAVTINPIPSNYGLITWDGSALTVS